MPHEERKDQPQQPVVPDQKEQPIEDLAARDVSKDEAKQAKGGFTFGAREGDLGEL